MNVLARTTARLVLVLGTRTTALPQIGCLQSHVVPRAYDLPLRSRSSSPTLARDATSALVAAPGTAALAHTSRYVGVAWTLLTVIDCRF